MRDYGLVHKIGPAERSGLYEITPRGKAVLTHQDQYDESDEFDALIDEATTDIATQDDTTPASPVRNGNKDADDEQKQA